MAKITNAKSAKNSLNAGLSTGSLQSEPWAWILLALNPLFIVNGVHTIDFYIKAIWISFVLTLAFFGNAFSSKPNQKQPLGFTIPELFWIGYMIWGALALTWSVTPILGFERLVYLLYPVGGYIIGKQTRFWESKLFWNVFAGVALLVGLGGGLMWWFGGDANLVMQKSLSQVSFRQFIGLDWIMSAGRPSSTLSYRAYAGTYMVMTLPFLLWFLYSRFVETPRNFLFVAISFILTFDFLIYSRARSAWLGFGIFIAVMFCLAAWRKLIVEKSWSWEQLGLLNLGIFGTIVYILAILSFDFLAFFRGHSIGVNSLLIAIFILEIAIFGKITWRKISVEKSWSIKQVGGFFAGFIVLAYLGKKGIAGDGAIVIYPLLALLMLVVLAWFVYTEKSWREKWYVTATLVFSISIFTALIPGNKELIKGDTNPQRLEGTGKESFTGALATMNNVFESGGGDRQLFWTMSRSMLFNPTPGEEFKTPFGVPRWALGVGIGQFPIYVPYHSDILHSLGAEIHNDWIQAFTELGPVGFFFFTGFMLILLFYSVKNYHKGLMIATAGSMFAWVFSTMSDFLTPRIYGALWVGGIAAIVYGEADLKSVLRISALKPQRWFGLVAGFYFIWLGVAYGITMWADRQIYTALVTGKPPVDNLVSSIFPFYNYGVGKYLIFSPITDLSRAVSKEQQKKNSVPTVIDNVQATIAKEVLAIHPTNYNAMALLTDIEMRKQNYKTALEFNKKYLVIRPKDKQMWLVRSQMEQTIGDSTEAAKSAYEALKAAPDDLMTQQFWQTRVSERLRNEVSGKK